MNNVELISQDKRVGGKKASANTQRRPTLAIKHSDNGVNNI